MKNIIQNIDTEDFIASVQRWSNVGMSTPTFPPTTNVSPTCPCYLGSYTVRACYIVSCVAGVLSESTRNLSEHADQVIWGQR